MTQPQRITVTQAQADAISYYRMAIADGRLGKLLYADVALHNAGISETFATEAIAMGYVVGTEITTEGEAI